MRKPLSALFAILISVSAFAGVIPDATFDVTGPKAVALEKALVIGGAVVTHTPTSWHFGVSSVDCEAGFAEHSGGGPSSYCTFLQVVAPVCGPGGTCTDIVKHQMSGARGKALDIALENAGVKANAGHESSRRFAVSISCYSVLSGFVRTVTCHLEVPGGM